MNRYPEGKLLYISRKASMLYGVGIFVLAVNFIVFKLLFSDPDSIISEFSSNRVGILIFIILMILPLILFFVVLWLNGRYILWIIQESENEIRIKTWSLFGLKSIKNYPVTILKHLQYMGDQTFLSVPYSNTPWIKVRTPSRRTLILDLQGEFHEKPRFRESVKIVKPSSAEERDQSEG